MLSMFEQLIFWLVVWGIFLGLPQLAYKLKGNNFLYQNKPYLYTIWFLIGIIVSSIFYKKYLLNYFQDNYTLLVIGILLIVVFYICIKTKNIHSSEKKEKYNISFKIPKIFEILFQQVTFLGGLLTFNLNPIVYGLLFFLIHIPLVFLLPKRFSHSFIIGSLFGGIIFAFLQSWNMFGFLLTVFFHFTFYIILDIYLSKKL